MSSIRAHSRIDFVAAAVPPALDGIGDYTARLAAEVARKEFAEEVRILTDHASAAAASPIDGVTVRGAFDALNPTTADQLLDTLVTQSPEWAVLQYNPFGYGRWGLNLQLPRAMAQIRKRSPNTRLAVMFHEMFVPVINWKFAIMATYQRWQFRRLIHASNLAFFSIEPWAQQVAKWFPEKPIHHLPVGSNIPRIAIPRQEARQRLGIAKDEIVLGVFGTAHASRSLGLIQPAAQAVRSAGKRVRVLYVGPDQAAIQRAAGDLPLLVGRHLSAEDVSRWLSAINIYLATYSDGVSTRRGAMMAALQHGISIVGTAGHNTDPELMGLNGDALLLTQANDRIAFASAVGLLAADPHKRHQMGQRASEWFADHYSWPVIAEKMMSALESSPCTGIT